MCTIKSTAICTVIDMNIFGITSGYHEEISFQICSYFVYFFNRQFIAIAVFNLAHPSFCNTNMLSQHFLFNTFLFPNIFNIFSFYFCRLQIIK